MQGANGKHSEMSAIPVLRSKRGVKCVTGTFPGSTT